MIRVTFACGHPAVKVPAEASDPPVCPLCQERQVRSVQAPAPRFRGFVQGPTAQTMTLDAIPVAVAPKGPLFKE